MLRGRKDVIVLNPPKIIFLPVNNSIVAVTLLVMVVSSGKKADLQRVGVLSS